VLHLPTKSGADIIIQSGDIHIFQNPRWPPLLSWIFRLSEFGTLCHVDSPVLVLCIKFGSNSR